MSHHPRRLMLLGSLLAVTLLAACTPGHSGDHAGGSVGGKPNIVFVLTDDLSWNLVQYMPHVQQLKKQGLTFPHFYVVDSLCCPSRSSILTGEYPHDTGVFTNGKSRHRKGTASGTSDGGFDAFNAHGDQNHTFGLALQGAGYRTGFMGKYLNGYQPSATVGTGKPYVAPGWDEWDVAGQGYAEFNYDLNENGKVVHFGKDPQDYLTDVLAGKAKTFIDSSTAASKPFALEVATFAPHKPSTPAPRDATDFPNLAAPRTAAYDKDPAHAPTWLTKIPPLADKDKAAIDTEFRQRVRSVQAVDDMIGNLEKELQAKGIADNTYIMFGSDNGYHMGEYQLRPGKQTAFDTDIRVPLMVTGPGVPKGKQVAQIATNIDLCPTFDQLGGVTPPSTVDGRSLLPLLHGQPVSGWRQAMLVEHHGPDTTVNDPDKPGHYSGNPPSYEAVRTADALYVEYADGEREYYDTATDPNELDNIAATVPKTQLAAMRATLTALKGCHGSTSCAAAAQLKR